MFFFSLLVSLCIILKGPPGWWEFFSLSFLNWLSYIFFLWWVGYIFFWIIFLIYLYSISAYKGYLSVKQKLKKSIFLWILQFFFAFIFSLIFVLFYNLLALWLRLTLKVENFLTSEGFSPFYFHNNSEIIHQWLSQNFFLYFQGRLFLSYVKKFFLVWVLFFINHLFFFLKKNFYHFFFYFFLWLYVLYECFSSSLFIMPRKVLLYKKEIFWRFYFEIYSQKDFFLISSWNFINRIFSFSYFFFLSLIYKIKFLNNFVIRFFFIFNVLFSCIFLTVGGFFLFFLNFPVLKWKFLFLKYYIRLTRVMFDYKNNFYWWLNLVIFFFYFFWRRLFFFTQYSETIFHYFSYFLNISLYIFFLVVCFFFNSFLKLIYWILKKLFFIFRYCGIFLLPVGLVIFFPNQVFLFIAYFFHYWNISYIMVFFTEHLQSWIYYLPWKNTIIFEIEKLTSDWANLSLHHQFLFTKPQDFLYDFIEVKEYFYHFLYVYFVPLYYYSFSVASIFLRLAYYFWKSYYYLFFFFFGVKIILSFFFL